MSSSHLPIMCLIMISLVPLHHLGNAYGLEFKKKCIDFRQWVPACTIPASGCFCCNDAPSEKKLTCYATEAECMARCPNPTI
ncbi:hypothetical protein Bca4012_041321 [Brassica carinata]|uniref:BnaA09g05720D protein n=3 Tax=Brassica TaxID=3705 RepID=A0A078FQQ5_BRANA|nr:hypothetical protein HID58_084678 [Brassica napus]QDF62986.1 pollen coat protein B30 [Brassica oleracea]CAF1716475.1 unnamed protein product [Brassica napus]CDY16810.1 BnaA09g05720D [Brassica napus]VDD28417.1 unnamed protein product [Brassica oleracea]